MAFLSLFSKQRLNAKDRKIAAYIKSLCGASPKNIQLYHIALTHQSYADKRQLGYNNERLEYLGDAALDMIISDYLYRRYPGKNEGQLTQLRAAIVNRQSLGNLAKAINLPRYINTEVDLSQPGVSLPGNALEAIIGAIYLDLGYERVADFVLVELVGKHLNLKQVQEEHENHKSTLLEWAQKMGKTISFEVDMVNSTTKMFEAKVGVDEETLGNGQGRSKKMAEQSASLEALKKLGVK